MGDRSETNSILSGSPFSQYQRLTITFSATPGADLVVRHGLRTVDPNDVEYLVLGLDRAGSIYHDQSSTRKAWGSDFLILRASVASLKADVLLTVPRIT